MAHNKPHSLAARMGLSHFYRERVQAFLAKVPEVFPSRAEAEKALDQHPDLKPLVIAEAKKFFTGDHV